MKLSDLSPKEKSKYYFIRAKRLFIEGGQYAVVVEYVLKDIAKAMSLDPRNPKHYMFMGKVYRCSLDIVSAIYCYRFVLQLDPTSFVARDKLAECLQLFGQELMCEALKYKDTNGGFDTILYKRAKYCVEEASKFKLEDQRLRIFGLVCLVHLNKLDQALEIVNRLVKHSKNTEPELFVLRAKLLWAAGLVGEGNKDIRYAAASYPDHPEVLAFSERVFSKAEKLYSMSLEAFAIGRYNDARRLVVYALSISKEDVKLLILLAKVLRVLGDMKGAYATIQKAMLIYQDTVSLGFDVPEEIVRQTNLIFNEMAIKYATEGEYEKSIALLSKIISSEKALSRGLTDIDPKYYLNRGDCYRMTNDMARALGDYVCALETCPGDQEIKTRISLAYYYSGTDYFNQSFYQQAEQDLTEAIGYNSNVAEYYATRGQARYYGADYPGAYKDYKKALELDPNHEEVKNRIKVRYSKYTYLCRFSSGYSAI
jgi:tetratricopeptide (TPR) repeat protein